MKIKTAIISVVVSAALVASAGYGAYHVMRGKKSPVEVVPVSNVNSGGYWGISDSIYGSVTSQIAQTVQLDGEYAIEEIFVKVGDQVKEGTPLFSYDMTLQELELEMEQLNLQAHELNLTKLKKDLEKLKATPATASIVMDDFFMTTSSDDVIVEEQQPETDEAKEGSGGGADEPDSSGAETQQEPSNDASGDFLQNAESAPEVSIDTIENLGDQNNEQDSTNSKEDQEHMLVLASVAGYEQLIAMIDSLFQSYEGDLKASEVKAAVEEAVVYYRKHLAEEQTVSVTDENGYPVEQKIYPVKASIQEILGDERTKELETYQETLEKRLIQTVELMIAEASSLEGEELEAAVTEIEKFHEYLSQESREKIEKTQEIEALAERLEESESESETDENTESNEGEAESGETTENNEGESGTNETTESNESESGTDETAENNESESESGTDENTGSDEGETTPDTESEAPGQTELPVVPEEPSTEQQTEQRYTVEVQEPGIANVTSAVPGTLVVLHTDTDIPGTEFTGWTVLSNGQVQDSSLLENFDPTLTDTTFLMPAMNLTLIPEYRIVPSEIDGFVTTFEELAKAALADQVSEQADYLTILGNAIDFYQQWLAEPSAEILDSSSSLPKMEAYRLKAAVTEYLTEQNREKDIEELENTYKKICKTYVKAKITALNPQALTRAELTGAQEAYDKLGLAWTAELEQEWFQEQTEKLEQMPTQQTEEDTEPTDEEESGSGEEEETEGQTEMTVLTLAELLQAYDMILVIQEIDMSQSEELLRMALTRAQEQYLALTDGQKKIVWNAQILIDALKQYGLWEQESEELQGGSDDGFGDLGGGFEEGYTQSELKEMIEQTEREIKDCELSIRESELLVKQCQRVVDKKIVKSTLEGTVVSIGSLDGTSEDEYFAKVTNEEGLYAQGSMNELSLEKIKVGDTISGMMMDTGVSFTATVKEISSYPSTQSDGMYYSYGSENTNASYYPFYALLDDTTDIEEGEAELQLSETMTNSEDSIYLEKYFVRTDNMGKSYVFIQGDDGKLKKQYVSTGKLMYGYALEILSGLSKSDKIAFPYGSDVVEGAETKEVDMLSAYM